MLKERTLEHQQVYQYKVHLAKIAHMAEAIPVNVASKVSNYLLSIFEDFPDDLFQENKTANLDEQAAPGGAPLEPPEAKVIQVSLRDIASVPQREAKSCQ